jgi:pyroglutamyl-peptidase
MKILITGFQPFLTHSTNPAETVAKALASKDHKVLILPVTYEGTKKELLKVMKKEKPNFILSLGLAASREHVSLEKNAFNEMNSSHPDAAGHLAYGEKILPAGKEILSTSIDLESLKLNLIKTGKKIDISNDPGRYCCNECYYLALASGTPALFVHLPLEKKSSLINDLEIAQALLNEIEKASKTNL